MKRTPSVCCITTNINYYHLGLFPVKFKPVSATLQLTEGKVVNDIIIHNLFYQPNTFEVLSGDPASLIF